MIAALEHTVLANNLSRDSENKIHSDLVAKQFGFEGALVGGVNVYAYMTHLPVSHYGVAWLERGRGECRFHKPVYDGRETRCNAQVQADGSLKMKVAMGDVSCATGRAQLGAGEAPPALDTIPTAPFPRPQDRPAGSPETLAAGTILGTFEAVVGAAETKEYCDGVRETLALYESDGIVHPGAILQMANRSLAGNVLISPWIHVSSTIQNYAVARIDSKLAARGRVLGEYEHKGHKFVELDVLIVSNDKDCIARVHHVAIYQPRMTG